MPSVIKQPPFGEFDRGQAKALRVKALFMLDVQNGCIVECVTGDKYAIGAGTVVYTPEGAALQFDGSQAFNITMRPGFFPTLPARDYCVAARIAPTAQQAGNPGQIFGLSASTSTQTSTGVGWDNSATPNLGTTFLHGSGAGTLTGGTVAATLNKFDTIFSFTDMISGGVHRNWINGVGRTPSDAVGGSAQLDEVTFGAQHRSAGFLRQAKGRLLWAAILDVTQNTSTPNSSAFDDAMFWSLYANDFPHNLFRRTRRILPGAAAAAFMARQGLSIPQSINRAATF